MSSPTPALANAASRRRWGRRLMLPGQLLPGLFRRGSRLMRSRATWTFTAGALVGALLTGIVTGSLSLPRAAPEQDVVLHLYGGTDSLQNARHRVLQAWNEAPAQKANRVQAEYHDIGGTADEQREKLSIALDPESPTRVDLVIVDLPDLPRFAQLDRLVPLSRPDTTGFVGIPVKACQDDEGRLWGLPLNADVPMLAYNVDLLAEGLQLAPQQLRERYTTPQESIYDQILHDGIDALRVLRSTHPELKAVYAGQFGDYEGFTVNVLEQLTVDGADIENDRYLEQKRSEKAIEAMKKRLMTSDFLPEGSWASPGTGESGYDETKAEKALRDGTVLFARLWPSNFRTLTDLKNRQENSVPDVEAVPLSNGVLGGQAVAIAKKSKHARSARELLEFLTGDLSQLQLFLEGGYLPTRQIIFNDPAATTYSAYLPGLLQAVNTAVLRPKMPYYAEYSSRLRKEIRHVLDDGELDSNMSDHLRAAAKGKLP